MQQAKKSLFLSNCKGRNTMDGEYLCLSSFLKYKQYKAVFIPFDYIRWCLCLYFFDILFVFKIFC